MKANKKVWHEQGEHNSSFEKRWRESGITNNLKALSWKVKLKAGYTIDQSLEMFVDSLRL